MLKKFVQLFQAKLELRLNEKTSWGRNDLKQVISEVLSETLLEVME